MTFFLITKRDSYTRRRESVSCLDLWRKEKLFNVNISPWFSNLVDFVHFRFAEHRKAEKLVGDLEFGRDCRWIVRCALNSARYNEDRSVVEFVYKIHKFDWLDSDTTMVENKGETPKYIGLNSGNETDNCLTLDNSIDRTNVHRSHLHNRCGHH